MPRWLSEVKDPLIFRPFHTIFRVATPPSIFPSGKQQQLYTKKTAVTSASDSGFEQPRLNEAEEVARRYQAISRRASGQRRSLTSSVA